MNKTTSVCPTCKGNKFLNNKACPTCKGVGQIVERVSQEGVRRTVVLNEG